MKPTVEPRRRREGPRAQAGQASAVRARRFSWHALVWMLVFPQRGQTVRMTLPGAVLIALALGVGLAAYNSANNILFITLSLLLSCLILSGVLSWLNLRALTWELLAEPPMRAGQPHPVTLLIGNAKSVLPTYGVWFEMTSTSVPMPERLVLRGRLDPRGETRLDWTVCPAARGRERLELDGVGSLFPFGFLRKTFAVNLATEVVVWPAPVEYRRFPAAFWERAQPGRPLRRAGAGGDLFALRRYQAGDSHRLIHWKASARLRHLMVTRHAAEGQDGYSLWLKTPADVWVRPEQFELLCSLAATLAEDLFTAGRLGAVAINDEPFSPVRRVTDLEVFLDRLAAVSTATGEETRGEGAPPKAESGRKLSRNNVLTFAPDGARGVAAYVDGEKAASA